LFSFQSEVSDHLTSLQIELWERGEFQDKLLGLCHIKIDRNDDQKIINNNNERWINLDSQLILNNQEQQSQSCHSTEHSILIRTYIEYPFDLTEEESKDLSEKLEILHEILDKKVNISIFSFFHIFCSLAFCRFHFSYDFLILYIYI